MKLIARYQCKVINHALPAFDSVAEVEFQLLIFNIIYCVMRINMLEYTGCCLHNSGLNTTCNSLRICFYLRTVYEIRLSMKRHKNLSYIIGDKTKPLIIIFRLNFGYLTSWQKSMDAIKIFCILT